MRKKTKMIIDPKYILIAISVICAILIVVSFKFQDKIEPVRSIVGGAGSLVGGKHIEVLGFLDLLWCDAVLFLDL